MPGDDDIGKFLFSFFMLNFKYLPPIAVTPLNIRRSMSINDTSKSHWGGSGVL